MAIALSAVAEFLPVEATSRQGAEMSRDLSGVTIWKHVGLHSSKFRCGFLKSLAVRSTNS